MSKVLLTSATGIAFLTAGITAVGFATGIYQTIDSQVVTTANRIVSNDNSQLSTQEKDNLLVAMMIGKVANATSEERAVKHHQTTQMIITNYNQTSNRQIYSSGHFARAD